MIADKSEDSTRAKNINMHSTLARQMNKYLPENPTKSDWLNFLKSVDETYRHFDESSKLINRSLELSSKELVEMNDRIASEKVKLETILESIGDALIVTDEKGQINSINRSGEDLLELKLSDVKGKNFLECAITITDEKNELVSGSKLPVALALKSGKKEILVCILERSDKTKFIVDISATPYLLNRKIAGAACIIRDITKEKEIDRAKGEFVSLASHQLRTPLSSIGWYAEMLLAGDAGEVNAEQKSYLEEIYRSNRRMVDLVNALLNVSRIELGTFMLTPEPVDLAEVMRSVIKESYPKIKEKELKIKESYKDLPKIPADSKLTRIIFQNIITNAIKYTPPEGSVDVKIDAGMAEDIGRGNLGEKYIFVSVADSGYGIPKYQQDKIFSKLFRADNVREKETDGTGLGLYLVKSVLDACGGEIWFESKENKGTTFNVIIPYSGMRAKAGEKFLE